MPPAPSAKPPVPPIQNSGTNYLDYPYQLERSAKQVAGPLTAYAQAEIINKHALESTGGKTYAELDREDPLRQTAMTASFLRASLFTSVVAYGVAAMAIGLGVVNILLGWALSRLAKR